MRGTGVLGLAIAWLCSGALAQVPEMGRWQDFDFSAEEVHRATARQYRDILAGLTSDGRLDDDSVLQERVRRIADSLIAEAIRMKPAAAHWKWEVHTTSDSDTEAYCMAGGKIMVGSHFVRALALDDAELATLIGHEIAHALADHHREAMSSALHISPMPTKSLDVVLARMDSDLSLRLRLSRLSNIQEHEADQLGMIIAHRAGWPSSGMIGFYRKLARIEPASLMSEGHPAAIARLRLAQALATLFQADADQDRRH